jgi:4-hydroxythreonine-4-phosphate dehydrogenase
MNDPSPNLAAAGRGGARVPRIGVTMGDPAGIGPEVVLKAVAEPEVLGSCVPVIVGDAQHLAHTARTLDLRCGYDIVRRGESLPDSPDLPVIYHLDNIRGPVAPGVESGAAGRAAAEYIEAAVELCGAGALEAIATAPINKRALFLGGYSFPGHTEFLAHLTGTAECAMAFVASNLRIVLISTHVPLSEAIRLVEKERIARVTRLAARELRRSTRTARRAVSSASRSRPRFSPPSRRAVPRGWKFPGRTRPTRSFSAPRAASSTR